MRVWLHNSYTEGEKNTYLMYSNVIVICNFTNAPSDLVLFSHFIHWQLSVINYEYTIIQKEAYLYINLWEQLT